MPSKLRKSVAKISSAIYSIRHRDEMILNDRRRNCNIGEVNLHWYSMMREDGLENLGDYLSTVVYKYMLSRKDVDEYTQVGKTKHLYAIGSIIFFGFQNATVWGSGCLLKPKSLWLRKLVNCGHYDIRAVRGPETRKILQECGYDCPEVYGDPAILMPYVYMPELVNKTKEYSVVLHKSSYEKGVRADNQIDIITLDYKHFVDELVSSKLVISSSLHGIILAESYGVPAILLADDRNDFSLFKYNDYYFSTGRTSYPVAHSVDEALMMTPSPIPDLEKLREGLLNSFPYDLFSK